MEGHSWTCSGSPAVTGHGLRGAVVGRYLPVLVVDAEQMKSGVMKRVMMKRVAVGRTAGGFDQAVGTGGFDRAETHDEQETENTSRWW